MTVCQSNLHVVGCITELLALVLFLIYNAVDTDNDTFVHKLLQENMMKLQEDLLKYIIKIIMILYVTFS